MQYVVFSLLMHMYKYCSGEWNNILLLSTQIDDAKNSLLSKIELYTDKHITARKK